MRRNGYDQRQVDLMYKLYGEVTVGIVMDWGMG
jgi:hypothetical protein